MLKKNKILTLLIAIGLLGFPNGAAAKKRDKAEAARGEITADRAPLLWRSPSDIAARNLFYGPGGEDHQPHSTFTFIKEDLDGTNPKFVVRDEHGVKWKVKLGDEARPETTASRLVWAAGYFTNENYFVPVLHVTGMPAHLHRGQKLIAPDGSIPNVRLKRYLDGEKKIGNWRWRDDPIGGTREHNGLRVVMALINNWDLTDENNAIYEEHGASGAVERIYMVSDLGSSFGTPGLVWPLHKARGNLHSYRHSRFIVNVTTDYVDFETPRRDSLVFLATPREFFQRLPLRSICKRVPRADARWTGDLLAQLSPDQIRDAFRAAGYSPEEIEGFTAVVRERIAALQKL